MDNKSIISCANLMPSEHQWRDYNTLPEARLDLHRFKPITSSALPLLFCLLTFSVSPSKSRSQRGWRALAPGPPWSMFHPPISPTSSLIGQHCNTVTPILRLPSSAITDAVFLSSAMTIHRFGQGSSESPSSGSQVLDLHPSCLPCFGLLHCDIDHSIFIAILFAPVTTKPPANNRFPQEIFETKLHDIWHM